MITVDPLEAKAHLSGLFDKGSFGEDVIITQHGGPVARLDGARRIDRARVDAVFDKLKMQRQGTMLGGLSWKALRDEGRP